MSVLITMKVKGDTAKFRASLTERADEFEATGKRAQAAGAIHHRFGLGDGYVVVVDEWETAEQFQTFFGDPELQAFIGEIGGDTSAPPEMAISAAVSSPDEF
jgi:quinol monooxygenase YgiN